MIERPSFLQGEDIFFTVSIEKKYIDEGGELYAYVFFDDTHGLITGEDAPYIEMTLDKQKCEATIHISHRVTASAYYMPIGTYGLEILSIEGGTEYRKIYQNKKQFDLKKSYIVLSGSQIINEDIAMALKNNQYQGETIDFLIEGDSVYNFGTDSETPFKVFIYPDGLDTSIAENRQFIKTIDSRDTDGNTKYGDGYIARAENNTAHAYLPYDQTQNMRTGSYTVEVLYDVNNARSVIMFNNAFILVESYSNEI